MKTGLPTSRSGFRAGARVVILGGGGGPPGGHFDDTRLVDDAGRLVAFLHDADDPRLVPLSVFGGFDLCAEAGSLLPGQTDQQSPCKGKRRVLRPLAG